MAKYLTDIHTHTKFSHDGKSTPQQMADCAVQKGMLFYGISEHFDYDLEVDSGRVLQSRESEEEYFHTCRHLQEDYAGCLNVLIGGEFAYTNTEKAHTMYAFTQEKYRPDYVINSVHCPLGSGVDYCTKQHFYKDGVLREKGEAYREYLFAVKASLFAPYAYDIVGHITYPIRYAPYEDRGMTIAEFGAEIDEILSIIIEKDKILEINSSTKGLSDICLPNAEILKRYYALGGRKVSYGSDAHGEDRLCDKREEVVTLLKEIGFTAITVPCKGEHIEVKL